jgi:hypothetical protein
MEIHFKAQFHEFFEILIVLIYGVCSFIGTDWSRPVLKAFVYWYVRDRAVQLLARVVIIYSGPDRF